jgi:3-oxoacyl-[acyl-carrier-protein] synthase III
MNITKRCRITGTGKYLPSHIVTSVELEKELDLPAGWIERFSGVKERRYAAGETNADMAVYALKQALENAEINMENVDLLISSSVTFDYILPYQAALILKGLGNGRKLNTPALDINSSCLSFVTAFDVAAGLLDGKKFTNIAIVSSEIASIGSDPADKESYTLFGDGAAAAILTWDNRQESGVVKSMMKTYPEGYYYSIIRGGGNVYHIKYNPYNPALHSFKMDGKKLLRLAIATIPAYFNEFLNGTDLSIEDIDVIITHQASKAGLSLFKNLYPGLRGTLYSNLDTHGNCIAASIPMCLHDTIEKGILKRGDSCLLTGTAAGFAIGSVLIKY